ncbi:MAG TPA: hypothetical protein VGT24_01540 [Candidatus Acidoferrales bacterium]|nr:hypothetical protein [Candidatus Acidoferrales bacterium]
MSPLREVTQANFSKGILATAQKFAQPKGILKNGSNLMFTKRGALLTRDGDFVIASLNGAGPTTGQGIMLDVAEYSPVGSLTEILFLQIDPNSPILAPAGLVAGTPTAGGGFAAGTYFWVVTAIDGIGGETTVSNEVSATVTANQEVPLSWTAVTNAEGYNVYRSTASGTEKFIASVSTNAFTDIGAASPSAISIVSITGGQIPLPGGGHSNFFNVQLAASENWQVGQSVTITGNSNPAFNVTQGIFSVLSSNSFSMSGGPGKGAYGTGGSASIPSTISPPVVNNTSQTIWVEIPAGSASYQKPANVIAFFPAGLIPALAAPTGGSGGGSIGTGTGGGGGGPRIPPLE